MHNYFFLIILISLSAGFAYINHRYIRMPFVIGLFFLSAVMSALVISSQYWNPLFYNNIRTTIVKIDLSKLILDIMLGFLLFAGSLQTSWRKVKQQIRPIGLFAIAGIFVSVMIIGTLFFFFCGSLGIEINFTEALLFGALISPTDPIAVLGILVKANVPKKMQTVLVGESLFNDGIGVVVFIVLLESLHTGKSIDALHFSSLFLKEAMGGVVFGLLSGYILHQLLKSIDNYETEVLLTIAFVMAGYFFCSYIHLSGALGMVAMGLFIGNFRQEEAISEPTLDYIHKFWELIDVILNGILFISIAFVMIIVDFQMKYFLISLVSVGIVLLSRIIIIYVPNLLFPNFTGLGNHESKLLVWGGLRGGLSIAMVLSLPDIPIKPLLLMVTYTCVVFSILIQGLSIEKLAVKLSEKKKQITEDIG